MKKDAKIAEFTFYVVIEKNILLNVVAMPALEIDVK